MSFEVLLLVFALLLTAPVLHCWDYKGPQTSDNFERQTSEWIHENKPEDAISLDEVDSSSAISWREGLNILKYWNVMNMFHVLTSQNPPKYPLSNIKMTKKDISRIFFRFEAVARRNSYVAWGIDIDDKAKILQRWIRGEAVDDEVEFFLMEGDFGSFYNSNRAGSLEERNLAYRALAGKTPGHWLIRYCSLNDTVNELDNAFAISHIAPNGRVQHRPFIRRKGWGIQHARSKYRAGSTNAIEFLDKGEVWESQYRFLSIFEIVSKMGLRGWGLVTDYDHHMPEQSEDLHYIAQLDGVVGGK